MTRDILLGEYEDDSPMIEHLENYIQSHVTFLGNFYNRTLKVEYLKTLSVQDLKAYHIHWGLRP